MANLDRDQLRRLARLGAATRLEQLRAEEASIRQEFPELFGGTAGRGRKRAAAAQGSETAAAKPGRKRGRRRKMSAEERRAVSERMRRYWSERRKAKGGK